MNNGNNLTDFKDIVKETLFKNSYKIDSSLRSPN